MANRLMSRALFVLVAAFGGLLPTTADGAWRNKRDMTLPVCGPWLQNASETTMSVSWITAVPCAAAIEYREKGTAEWTRHWETVGDKLAYTRDLHTFHLKGLKPSSEYEYRLLSSLSRYEQAYAYSSTFVGRETYAFRTFGSERTDYSVYLASDVHGHFGGIGEAHFRRPDVAKCDFAVFLGDQVDDNMNQPRYFIVDGYLDTVSRLWGKTKPTVFVRGNHDCWGAPAAQAWVDYHGRPDGVSCYSFSQGHVLYVVLDNPHDYSNGETWKAADAAQEVRKAFLDRQFAWFRGLVGSKAWQEAVFRVTLCHYPVRLGHSELVSSRYKPLFNGPDGIHLHLCGHWHYAASCLPGEVGCYHNARNDAKGATPRTYKASDGSFDFTEVCAEMFGGLLLEVSKDRLTIRTLDRRDGAPDLDRIEIRPDKTAKRLSCPQPCQKEERNTES